MPNDAIAVLTRKLETLTETVGTLKLEGEKLRWVVSDADVGLVQEVRELASIVGGLKETQQDHEVRIKAMQCQHDAEDKKVAADYTAAKVAKL
jgi:hypothetical protein